MILNTSNATDDIDHILAIDSETEIDDKEFLSHCSNLDFNAEANINFDYHEDEDISSTPTSDLSDDIVNDDIFFISDIDTGDSELSDDELAILATLTNDSEEEKNNQPLELPGIADQHYAVVELVRQHEPYTLSAPKIAAKLKFSPTITLRLCNECCAAQLLVVNEKNSIHKRFALGNLTAKSPLTLADLDEEQLKVLELFRVQDTISIQDIASQCNFCMSTAHSRRRVWVAARFLIPSGIGRKRGPYRLNPALV